MAVVFILGLLVSSLMERRAEVVSVFNNKRTVFEDSIVAQNEYAQDSAHRQSRHSDYARLHCRRYAARYMLDV